MGAAILLFILAGAAWLAAARPRAALLTTIFLAPWGGLIADFGLTVYAYQLVLLPLAVVTFVRSVRPGARSIHIAGGGLLLAFLLYAIVWSLLQIGTLPDAQVFGGLLRSPVGRAVVQIGYFVFTAFPVVLIGWLAARDDDIAACGRIYLASAVVLAVIGFGQLAIWYATGQNPLQVAAISTALGGSEVYSRQGAFDFSQLAIYRMNSFAGEPRQLGVTLVLAMLIIQAHALTARRPPLLPMVAIWLFLLAATVFTYSTSAALVWLIGTAVLLPAAWLFRAPVRRSPGSIGAAIGVIVAVIGLAVAGAEARGLPVIDLIAERTVDRLDESGALEDFDLAINDYLAAHPVAAVAGVGIGNIHLYAGNYLDPLYALYAEGTVFTAKTGYLRLISETGVIGLMLFLAWYARLSVLAAQGVRHEPGLAALVPIGTAILAIFLASGRATELWICAGVLTAAALRQPRLHARPIAAA